MQRNLKRISVFILTLVLFITNPPFTTNILAATSWTQSNWSGGAGQTSWSDTTKFSSSTEVTTSTANQATITSTEKLSNTGFETDLTGWTQTAENTAGTFTDANFLADSSAVAAWPLDDTTSTQSYSRVVNPAIAAGRNILVDGDAEASGTTAWTQGGTAIFSKVSNSPHGGTQALRVTNGVGGNGSAVQTIFTIGKTYHVTGYARSDGTSLPKVSIDNGATFSFTGTTSTSWQSFDFTVTATTTNLRLYNIGIAGLTADFDDVVVQQTDIPASSSTYSQVMVDGDMEGADTSSWTAGGTGSISKQTGTRTGGSGSKVLRITNNTAGLQEWAYQAITTIGKTYRITGWAKNDGVTAPGVYTGSAYLNIGTGFSSWQYFDVIFVAPTANLYLYLRTNPSGGYIDFDDVSVTEVDPLVGKIPVSPYTPTLGSAAGGHLTNAYSFDGTNDNVNIYSTDLNSAFNPSEGTITLWAKVSGAGVWSDAASRYIMQLQSNGSNEIILQKTPTTNQLYFFYIAGGTYSSVGTTSLAGSANWFQMAITWSKSNDQVKTYINGSQVGTTQTGMGTWTGNLSTVYAVIGSSDTSGTTPWSGLINDVRLYNTALSSTQISNLYNGFTATRDTTTKYAGTGSMKTVAEGHSNVDLVQSVNVGDTENYYLSAYAYTTGSAVTASDVELFYNGSTVSTTYTSIGSGWYKLSGIVTGANASRNYGVQVKSGKTVYVDDASLKPSSGTLTSSIFDTGGDNSLGTDYGSLTFSASTPTNTTASVKVRTSNNSDMSGATDFSSCNLLSSGVDIETSSCVTNLQRYVQYQLVLTNTDGASTPTFTAITLNFGPKATSSSPPGCSDSAPSSAPIITSISPIDQNTLQVVWSKAGNPVSYYALEYGSVSGTYTWGVASFGNSQTTSYTVGLLSPNTTYYFKVRAGNGCATGAWSNEASGTTSLITRKVSTQPTAAPSGIVPPSPKIPASPTPTPTTGPGPLPPEKPGGISLPSIDLQPISDFFRNNLNALSSFWNTVKTNTQQSLIAWGDYLNSFQQQASSFLASVFSNFEQKSLSLIASIFTKTGEGINTISDGVTYQTSNLLKTTNQIATQGTETYMKNLETSVRISTGNAFSLGFNISSIFDRTNREASSFVVGLQTSLASLGRSIFNSFSRTITLIAGSIGKSVTTIARTIDNSNKLRTAIAVEVNSNMVTTTGNAVSTIGSSVGNRIGMASNYVTKTVTTSLDATDKQLGGLANTINARFALISGATNKALTRVQTFIAMVSQYWFNSEPTKILVVDVTKTSPTSASITWQTNQLASSAVNYGFDTSYGHRIQSDQLVKDHKIELTDLEPNKIYFFEVMSQGKTYVYDSYYTFQTTDDLNQLFKKAKVEIIGNKGDWILVRNAPTKEGGVIAKVQVGQAFPLLMEKNGWVLIKIDSSEGWISGEFGKLIE